MLKQKHKIYQTSLVVLFFLFVFLHLYKLGEIPYTVNIDEAGLWYNVQSLLNFGMDQAGNTWPIMFANFYGEQSPMYTYLAFVCCKLFGESLWAIRLPGAICSVMIFIFGYKITDRVFSNKQANWLFCFLCTISPYFIMEFRYALDCNLMLCFITAFFHFFLKAIDSEKYIDAVVAGFVGGLTLYTYGLSYVMLPLFLLSAIAYLLFLKKVNWKQIMSFSLPLIVLATPLIIVQVINLFDLQELVIGNITFPHFIFDRHSDVTLQNFIVNIPLYMLYIFVGSELIIEDLLYSNFYLFFTPFIFIGGYLFIKDSVLTVKSKKYCPKFFFAVWFAIVLITVLSIALPASHRCNPIFISSILFITEGIVFLLNKYHRYKKTLIVLGLIFCIIPLLMFSNMYFDGTVNSHLHNTSNRWMFEPLDNVLKEIEPDETTCFVVDQIYYKIITKENPMLHPYVYEVEYIESEKRYSIKTGVYSCGAYVFHLNEKICETIRPNVTYVIPDKYPKTISKFESPNYTKKQIGHYLIFRPSNN